MLNEAIRLMRVFHDLSQKELAEKIGISKSFISEIESGRKSPTIELLNKYSDFFEIPVSSIMFFSENLDEDTSTKKIKAFVSSKVIAMLNFIAERSSNLHVEE
jgi:transcriptional regulator with XRE-family HTH domain